MSTRAPKNGMRPVHPGEVLREEFLKPLGLSANALAKALRVPASRINDIALERRGVTRGHGHAAGPLIQRRRQDKAEPADRLRSEGRRKHPRGENR